MIHANQGGSNETLLGIVSRFLSLSLHTRTHVCFHVPVSMAPDTLFGLPAHYLAWHTSLNYVPTSTALTEATVSSLLWLASNDRWVRTRPIYWPIRGGQWSGSGQPLADLVRCFMRNELLCNRSRPTWPSASQCKAGHCTLTRHTHTHTHTNKMAGRSEDLLTLQLPLNLGGGGDRSWLRRWTISPGTPAPLHTMCASKVSYWSIVVFN